MAAGLNEGTFVCFGGGVVLTVSGRPREKREDVALLQAMAEVRPDLAVAGKTVLTVHVVGPERAMAAVFRLDGEESSAEDLFAPLGEVSAWSKILFVPNAPGPTVFCWETTLAEELGEFLLEVAHRCAASHD
jgi:hypothetical protein